MIFISVSLLFYRCATVSVCTIVSISISVSFTVQTATGPRDFDFAFADAGEGNSSLFALLTREASTVLPAEYRRDTFYLLHRFV